MIATSYPPGHNFWPGTPVEWMLRGTGTFLVVVGPAVFGAMVASILLRRRKRMALGFSLMLLGYAVSFLMSGANVHDSDMPVFRGFMWGVRSLPWLAVAGFTTVMIAAIVPAAPSTTRGFAVIEQR